MHIQRLDAPFGAEITGLDLSRPLDPASVETINRAFVDDQVLCFRDQHFATPDEFLTAASAMGEPMPPVTGTYRLAGYEAIEEISSDATDRRTGDATPLRRGGSWHTDHSNLPRPPKATVLYAIHVPTQGGNTEFTSLQAAYEALDAKTKERLRGRRVFEAYLSCRAPRRLLTRTAEEERESSGAWQPLVRQHPESGRPSLYFNPMRDDAVEGMTREDGDRLLDELYALCDEARFRYSHRWRPGHMLIWDNRSLLHQACFDFDPRERRYLHRIMLRGDTPIMAP